jgi:hypothetical protein
MIGDGNGLTDAARTLANDVLHQFGVHRGQLLAQPTTRSTN